MVYDVVLFSVIGVAAITYWSRLVIATRVVADTPANVAWIYLASTAILTAMLGYEAIDPGASPDQRAEAVAPLIAGCIVFAIGVGAVFWARRR